MLKYMRYQVACDIAFGVFMVVWFISRHVLYLIVCWSIYIDLPKSITYGCYWGSNANLKGPIDPPDNFVHLTMPFRDPQGLVCFYDRTTQMFLVMLMALQVLLLLWFGMIMRVAWKVIHGGEAEDSRSDDEDEDEEESVEVQQPVGRTGDEKYIEVLPLEEEVGVEAINLSGRLSSPARRMRKGAGVASGVTLPSDRKELLGRIGCDKGSSG
jgi:acyl-CoA-dependent ceramide synthase